MDTLAPFGAAVMTILAVWGITRRQFDTLSLRLEGRMDSLEAKLDQKADKSDVRDKADKSDVRDLTIRIDNLMMEFLRWQRPPA